MKQLHKIRKERGAIMVMTALMLTVLLGFTALSIDIGMHHYLGAKLQNAADAAALAAGTMLDADESERYNAAYDYLEKNGYDRDEVTVKIDYKGVAPEAADTSVHEYDEYISKGYMRVSVDASDDTLFGNALGIRSLHLHKESYVLIQPNYEGMPEALKYSIFAGARLGDYNEKDAQGNITSYIDKDNPAMDIQGSTGAGSGETAFSSVVAVAENTINGVNDFVQNFKGWMNSTFGTSFTQDYNKLVNINVSEAVMNNDSHSNSNILIGVQALNVARTKDNDYTGASPADDTDSNYAFNQNDEYNGHTDAEDYGAVHFTAVEGRDPNDATKYGIKFGYSLYAEQRASNFISQALVNYLNTQSDKARVYTQNMINVQAIQHTINILNEMDLDNCHDGTFAGTYGDGEGEFEKAAIKYFEVNSKVSDAIKTRVFQLEPDLTFHSADNTVTLDNQEAIVYRVSQKEATDYLNQYSSIAVDRDSKIEEQRLSRLEQMTALFQSEGYDKVYRDNSSENGLLYAGYADKDGGNIDHEKIVLERYEDKNGNHADKEDDGARLKYTYTLTINGTKVNRNLGNMEEYIGSFNWSNALNDVKATRLGAYHSVTRTFIENSDYISMPNLRPYFVRQINQSVRDATKKRGQLGDGTTTGDKSVVLAVQSAQNGLNEVTNEVNYTDSTYEDLDEYTNGGTTGYAKKLLFNDFKANADSGLTQLTSAEQTLGGVSMSNDSFKGFDLYDNNNKLKTASDFVEEYDDEHGAEFGHTAVNAYANKQTHAGGKEETAVANKKTQIYNTYGSAVSGNSGYATKKVGVEDAINALTKPVIPDINGATEEEQQQMNADRGVEIATPTNPLATMPDQIFLGGNGAGRNGLVVGAGTGTKRAEFNTAIINNQSVGADDFNAVSVNTSQFNSGYTAATVTFPEDYTTAISSIPGTDAFSLPVENQNGWKWEAWVNSDSSNWELQNKKIYGIASDRKIKKSLYVKSGNTSYIFGYMDINANGKSLDLGQDGGSNATLYVDGDIDIRSGQTGHIDFRTGCKLYTTGFIWVQSGSSWQQRQLKKGAYVQVGKFYRSGAGLDIGEENATASEKATMICSGEEKLNLTIDGVNYNCGYAISGTTTVWQNSELYVNGDMVNESDSGYLLLKSNSKAVINGDLLVRKGESSKGIYVEPGATLYVAGDITLWEQKIENYGTIVCGGKIDSRKGDIVNNGTIYAGSVSVGSGTTRWLYNNGTFKTTGDVWVNGQFLNNNSQSDITVEAVIGGNLTTKSTISNYPGKHTGFDATLRVNGTIDTNGNAIYNNFDNNVSGSTARLYVNAISDACGALYNYQPGVVLGGSGALKPTNIYNKENCVIKTNGSIDTTTITNSSGAICSAVGDLKASTVTSSGAFGCGGILKISNSLNASHGITVGDEIQGTGDFTCAGITCVNKITAKSINTSGNVRTNGDIALTGDLTIGNGVSVTTTNGDLTAVNITNNNSLLVHGKIKATGKLTNKNYVLCLGNVETTGDLDNGTTDARSTNFHCFGNMTVGAHLDNYGNLYLGYDDNGTMKNGALTVNGNNGTHSISSFGSIYACGNINTNYENYLSGTDIYTIGDFIACKTGGTNLMEMLGTCHVYIRGMLTTASSQAADKHIWMHDGSNTVLSVLGNGAAANVDCFGNKLDELCNQHAGSNIYLGTNLYLAGTGSYTDESTRSDKLVNAGRLYVNGSIVAPNAKSISLYGSAGSYNTEKDLPSDNAKNNAKYSYGGITYCKDEFNAPNATVILADDHLLYVEDTYDADAKPGKCNILVKSVIMKNNSVLFSPNTASITGDMVLRNNAVVNIRKKIETTPRYSDDFSGAVYAPITVDLTGAPLMNITTNIVFNTGKTAGNLRGTNVRIKVNGNLTINGEINLKNSVLIVTGNLICRTLTMDNSNLWVQGTTLITNNSTTSGTGGAVDISNGSLVRLDDSLIKAGSLTIDKSTVFATEGIASATTLSLDHKGQLFSRDDNANKHDDNVILSGDTTVKGQSKVYVDGDLRTTSLTVDDASEVLGYTGIVFPNGGTAAITIDRTTHGANNSLVFCGENMTDTVYYNWQIDGTLYLPGGKHFGNTASTYPTVYVHNTGIVICDSAITSTWVQVGDDASANGKATLYCAEKITLKDNATYTNYGKLYAYGGTDIANARKAGGNNDYDFNLLQNGSETFLGSIYNGGVSPVSTYTTAGYYTCRGTVYIDASLNVTGKTTDGNLKLGGNRDVGLYMPEGAVTYVSGNATFGTGNATRIERGGGFITGGDLNVSSTIWNFGKLHIYGAFNLDNNNEWITDNKNSKNEPYKGWSLQNGWNQDNGGAGASFLAYNHGDVGTMMTFKGYVKNSGNIHMNYGLSVEGFATHDGVRGDYAFVNYVGSNAQFAGEFRCNGNRFFNKWNTSFGCDGRFTYSEIAYNCGKMYVGGDMIDGGIENDNYQSFSCRKGKDVRDNEVGWFNINGSPSRSFSFMNGTYKVTEDTTKRTSEFTWPEATLFVGGNMQIGDYESQKKAGTVLNLGDMYTGGSLKVYSWGGNETNDTGPAFYQTSLMAFNDSNTFVGGECYSGSAAVTGKNSIFMCDGDLRVRRPLKVNMWFKFYNNGGSAGDVISYFEDGQYKGKGWLGSNDDGFRACYMRVGGSVYANVEGRDLENFLFTGLLGDIVPYDHSRDIDIQANANIMIGGGFYCPQKLYLKQNVNMTICNEEGKGLYDSNGNLNWKARGLDELASQSNKDNPLVYGPGVTSTLTNNVNSILDWISNKKPGEECALFAYMLLDMNICSQLVVHGNTFVRDTCKIRDMTKTYIYGDMIAKNYLEIGKSLNDSNEDATEARLEKYRAPGENDTKYVFSNAGYMYVSGNMQSTKYSKIYASTTVKVGGDMRAGDWTQVLGNPYITLRHDARLFVGGNMTAYSSIDCGAYSELYVRGNCTAYTQNIKLRDQMACYIGGDMAAATYIELGKYDTNFYRGVKSQRVQQYLDAADDDANRPENDGSNNDVSDGGEFAYNGDEHEVGNNDNATEAGNDNQSETGQETQGDTNSYTNKENEIMKEETELGKDDTDLSVGSEYYIGGNIISFTKYIREYAYSRVVSGGYVMAVQHVTLRHNADLWVLPEVFGKTTYHTTVYQHQPDWDANLWNRIKDKVAQIAHDVKEDFEPKAGSVYSLGQLTLNKNASIFGTYDTMVFGQTVLRKASLIYMGHDFDCWAPIYNLQSDFSSFDGFMNSMKANLGLSTSKSYKGFDSYDETQNDEVIPKPIVVYANNEINVSTTARIRSTYFVANRGNVNFTNLNFISETSETTPSDAINLPNAFASYQGDVNFYALRGSLGALMYAPVGNVDLDGFAYNFYGSIVGHTVDINTFYINVHRFNNWRSMDLHIATSKNVYLIPQEEYDTAKDNVDDLYLYGYETNPDTSLNEWAQPFFPGLKNTDTSGDQLEGGSD
ncbi:MAG: hypothetical protein E7520_05310 [Ruminococcaceae bacterium]|nr:hypothetical protein [Oscillospiraceae bacterium]